MVIDKWNIEINKLNNYLDTNKAQTTILQIKLQIFKESFLYLSKLTSILILPKKNK